MKTSLRSHGTGLLCVLAVGAGLTAWDLPGADFTIDFSRTNGTLRPLHGVNLGPLCYRGTVDLTAYHRELGIPFTRLHDVVWVQADAVDISTLFRDFGRDPGRPESYDFAATDDYLQAVLDTGAQVVYRLGESIEHTQRKYRVHPPSDPAKWAAICRGVIRHYNEGWADGFRHGIRYWEIWNEPENQPAMWTGTDEQYFELYAVTARAIKAQWPDLMVGGPSLGATGQLQGDSFQPHDFMIRFLRFCRDQKVPLDFFSWHRYTADPSDFARRARGIRRVLDEHGFTSTESHCNEWNYLPNDDWTPMGRAGQGEARKKFYAEIGGPAGAAFATWVLLSFQDAPVDMANYYTGEIQGFGLFDYHGIPKKTYYAFQAFRMLMETPRRVPAPESPSWKLGVGLSRNLPPRIGLLASHLTGTDPILRLRWVNLPWPGPTRWEQRTVDADQNLGATLTGRLEADEHLLELESSAPAVIFLELCPAD